jgi:23S rRNA pseudouridine2605 synthase
VKPTPSTLPLNDPSRGERLQRVLAQAGIASRRACEQLVEEGHVEINGSFVTELPIFVHAADRIVVDGRPVAPPERKLYVMLNKPSRTVTTSQDEAGLDRRTVVDLVNHPSGARLFPVGRLDFETLGLLLLTNDGDFANALTHPKFGLPKTYRALVRGRLEDVDVKTIERGIYLADRKEGQSYGASRTARVGVQIIKRDRDRTTLELTLKEGRNRQVRRMLAALGYPVKKLERVAIGPLKLKGLARGEWRELKRDELATLRKTFRASGNPPKPIRNKADKRGPRTKKT